MKVATEGNTGRGNHLHTAGVGRTGGILGETEAESTEVVAAVEGEEKVIRRGWRNNSTTP